MCSFLVSFGIHPFKRVLNDESFELVKYIIFGIVAVVYHNDIIRSVIRFRISIELLFDNLVPCGRRAIRLFFLATIHKEEELLLILGLIRRQNHLICFVVIIFKPFTTQ